MQHAIPFEIQLMRKSKTRFVYIPRPTTFITTISAMCKVGSCQETRKLYGAAHFLEHMLFKGTSSRPNNNQISDELDSLGAQFNAYTDKYVTSFEVKVNSKFARQAIDIISDMLCNSTLPSNTVDMEKKVVIEENNISLDSPTKLALDHFIKLIFQGHPLAHSIGGTNDIVSQYTQKSIYKFYKKHYCTNNFVVSICSNLSLSKLQRYLSKSHFGKTTRCQNPPRFSLSEVPLQRKGRLCVISKPMEQAHVIIGFPCGGLFHRDRYSLKVLAYILAGGLSSRLYTDLRIKHGLSYSIGMDTMFYLKNGCIFVMTSFSKDRVLNTRKGPGGVPLIFQNLQSMQTTTVSRDELKKAKNILVGQCMFNLENSQSLSDYYGRQILFREHNNNEVESIATTVQELEKVTAANVRRMAEKYFTPSQCNIVILGGDKTETQIKRALRQYVRF